MEQKPGYYPDPERLGFMRYWNGTSWDVLIPDEEIVSPEVEEDLTVKDSDPLLLRLLASKDMDAFLSQGKKTTKVIDTLRNVYPRYMANFFGPSSKNNSLDPLPEDKPKDFT